MSDNNRISRRDFLKMSGLLSAGFILGGFINFLGISTKRSSPFASSSLISPASQIASAQTTGGGGSWAVIGQTSAPAIHSCLLRTGKIFYVAGSGYGPLYPTGTYKAKIIDPNTSAETDVPVPEDLFCGGQSHLANGDIFFDGGTLLYDSDPTNCNGKWHGLSSAYVFQVGTGSLVKVQSMAHGRWYPTNIIAADGTTFVLSGLDEYGTYNLLLEVYDPNTQTFTIKYAPNRSNTWCVGSGQTSCTGAGSPCYGSTNNGVIPNASQVSFYPRMHLMPSGLLFVVGMSQNVWRLDPSTGAWNSVLTTSQNRQYGTSFLLPLQNTTSERGKVLIVGGSTDASTAATATAEILDFNQGTSTLPVLRSVASLQNARKFAAPVILPNGKCVLFGGSSIGASSPVYVPEMFDPVTETWQSLPTATVARTYHQVSLLLPDGRVWTASSTPRKNNWEPRIEVFSPDYISAGTTRPTISGTPTVGDYGAQITIPTPDPSSITSVSLVRLMATTHHYDANQRLVWLQIVNRGSSSITVSAPTNANIAPPGYYMIHLLNASLIPSVASIIKIPGSGSGSPTPPAQVTGLTATTASSTQLNLGWTANPTTDNVTKYNVYRSTTAGFTVNTATDTPIAQPTSNSYSDTGLTASTTYYYRVAAVNSSGVIGTPSDIASATTASQTTTDTTAPTTKITSPTTGSSVPAGGILVNGTAADNAGGSGVRTVQVRVDLGAFATATPASPGDWSTWSITVNITSTGSHKITSRATDNAGITGGNYTVTITVV